MSSSEDNADRPNSAPAKKRKIQRACDMCRRKKIRCDGADAVDNKCSNCVSYGFDCTYVEAAKKRGPPKGYVESLENRLDKMEKLLKQLVPDIDLSGDLAKLATSLDTLSFPKTKSTSAPEENHCALLDADQDKTYSAMNLATMSIRSINAETSSQNNPDSLPDGEVDADDLATLTLADNMKRMTLDNEYRFFGKSSGIMLIQTALDIKKEYAKATGATRSGTSPSLSSGASGPSSTSSYNATDYNVFHQIQPDGNPLPGRSGGRNNIDEVTRAWMPPSLRRPEFWTNRPWERSIANQRTNSNVPSEFFPATLPRHMPYPDPSLPVPSKDSIQEAESHSSLPTSYTFPPPDLLYSLVELYFEHSNTFMPLLHKPTFMRYLAEGRHLAGSEDGDSFGANVLLVCAVGSRWSCDPRVRLDVLLEGETPPQDGENDIDGEFQWHSNGWKWFNQVQLIRKSLLQPPNLWDLQFYCLSVMFLQATSAPQACWTMVGIGIRLAQDVGAHRRKIRKPLQPNSELTPEERKQRVKERMEEEEWGRAWWVLVCLDRMLSSAMGRPCAIQDEDFDLELPLDVDDEYWEDPLGEDDVSRMFKQPENQPSALSFFIQLIKLMKLLAFSLRTIYSINKSKILLGLAGQQWEQHIVAEIDSALNKWVDNVSDHLRWDPHQPNRTFFGQSVILYAHYYHLQILIHRPFIPSPKKPSPLSFPSLAICTNAARSCSHVVDIHRRRTLKEEAEKIERGEPVEGDGRTKAMQPYNLVSVFTSGIVLLLNIWGGKRAGLGVSGEGSSVRNGMDLAKEMGDVHKCMAMLKLCEERWHSAGRLWDILAELTSVGDLPMPSGASPPSAGPSAKRAREDTTTPDSSTGSTPSSFVLPPIEENSASTSRNIASNKRVMAQASNMSQPQQQSSLFSNAMFPPPSFLPPTPSASQEQQRLFNLPMYSNELGSLPLHGLAAGDFGMPTDLHRHMQQQHQEQQPAWFNTSVPPIPSSSSSQQELGYDSVSAFWQSLRNGIGGSEPSVFNNASSSSSSSSYPQMERTSIGGYPSLAQLPGSTANMAGLTPFGGNNQGLYGGLDIPLDSDTMAMWSNAPTGFELDDWGAYLELAQGMHQAHQGSV